MKITIEVDPESTAYIFANSFSYEWFGEARIVGKPRGSGLDQETWDVARHVAYGGTVRIQADDPNSEGTKAWYTVTPEMIERGYAMSIKAGGCYIDQLFEGGADSNACDAWLQYAIYGKLVWG